MRHVREWLVREGRGDDATGELPPACHPDVAIVVRDVGAGVTAVGLHDFDEAVDPALTVVALDAGDQVVEHHVDDVRGVGHEAVAEEDADRLTAFEQAEPALGLVQDAVLGPAVDGLVELPAVESDRVASVEVLDLCTVVDHARNVRLRTPRSFSTCDQAPPTHPPGHSPQPLTNRPAPGCQPAALPLGKSVVCGCDDVPESGACRFDIHVPCAPVTASASPPLRAESGKSCVRASTWPSATWRPGDTRSWSAVAWTEPVISAHRRPTAPVN